VLGQRREQANLEAGGRSVADDAQKLAAIGDQLGGADQQREAGAARSSAPTGRVCMS
jgi:hypothetical protein